MAADATVATIDANLIIGIARATGKDPAWMLGLRELEPPESVREISRDRQTVRKRERAAGAA